MEPKKNSKHFGYIKEPSVMEVVITRKAAIIIDSTLFNIGSLVKSGLLKEHRMVNSNLYIAVSLLKIKTELRKQDLQFHTVHPHSITL